MCCGRGFTSQSQASIVAWARPICSLRGAWIHAPLQPLHLTGYDLSLADLKKFRQWGSRTPGHPEFGLTPGVETTTGPLGQGFANAVGMALAQKVFATRYHRGNFRLFDYFYLHPLFRTVTSWRITSEAASFARFIETRKADRVVRREPYFH